MQSMIQSMTSVNRETQEVLIPQFSFSVRFIPHSIRIKCPRWKDIVWLTSRFKSQLSKAKFDKESKSTQHSTLNASPRCIYPTQTCGENTLWGGRPERGEKNVHWGYLERSYPEHKHNKHKTNTWYSCGENTLWGRRPERGAKLLYYAFVTSPWQGGTNREFRTGIGRALALHVDFSMSLFDSPLKMKWRSE